MSFFPLNPVTAAVSLTCALACGAAGAQTYQVNVKKRGQPEVQSYTLKDNASPANRTVSLAITSPRGRVTYGQDNVAAAVLNSQEVLEILPNEQHRYNTMINEAAALRAQSSALRAEINGGVGDSRSKAGWSALTDGLSTMGVIAAGGMEFNPLMPVSPLGIAAVTAAKIYGSTAFIDDMEPVQKERVRRLSSAGWTGATVANVAALAGLFPATAFPLGAAAGLLQYSMGADEALKAQKQEEVAALDARVDSLVATAQSYRTQALVAAHQRKADRLYVRPVVQEVLVASADNAVVFDQIQPKSAQTAPSIVRQPHQNGQTSAQGQRLSDPRFANVGSVYIYSDEDVQTQVATDKLSAERAALVQQQLQAGLSQRQATGPARTAPSLTPVAVPVSLLPSARTSRAAPVADLPPVSISTPYGAYTPHPSKRAALMQAGLVATNQNHSTPVSVAPSGADPWTPSAPLAQVTPLPRGGIQVADLDGNSVKAGAGAQAALPSDASKPVMVDTVLNQAVGDTVLAPVPAGLLVVASAEKTTAPASLRVGQDTYERAMAFIRQSAGQKIGQEQAEVPVQLARQVVHVEPTLQVTELEASSAVHSAMPDGVHNVVHNALPEPQALLKPALPVQPAQPAPPSRLVRETLAVPAQLLVSGDAEPSESEDLTQQMPALDRAAIGAVQKFSGDDAMQASFALGRPVAVDPNAVSPLAPVFELPSRRVPTIKAAVSEYKSAPTLQEIQRQYDFEKTSIPRYLQANPAPESPVVSYWD